MCTSSSLSVHGYKPFFKESSHTKILRIGILGQVWYLIVSIPDLCTLIFKDDLTVQESVINLGSSFCECCGTQSPVYVYLRGYNVINRNVPFKELSI